MSTTPLPIDLSQVPPQDVMEEIDLSELVRQAWARAVADQPVLAGLAESDPARKWLRTVAIREGLCRAGSRHERQRQDRRPRRLRAGRGA